MKLDQTWSNLIKLDQTWSNLIKLDQIRSNLIKLLKLGGVGLSPTPTLSFAFSSLKIKKTWLKLVMLENLQACFSWAKSFRHVARSENLEGRVIRGAKNLGGRAVRAGPKSGGRTPSLPPPSNMPVFPEVFNNFETRASNHVSRYIPRLRT